MSIGLTTLVQKLPSSIRDAVRFPYSVGGKSPELVADFENEYYRANGGKTTSSSLINHSRSGNATMVDSDGLLKWAPHNLLTYSGDLSQATWALSGATREVVSNASPVGTDAYKIVGSAANTEHKFYQTLPSTYTHSMTVAVFAKAAGYNFLGFRNQTNSVWDTTFFNLSTGQVGTVPSNVTASMEDVGNGWYLCKAVYPLGLSYNRIQLNSVETDGVYSFAADETSGTLVWGAHLYRSDLGGMVDNPDQPASLASYVPTTSAAVYLPRRGHHVYNGSAWVNEGLLHESEARTNLETYSDILDAQWTKTELSILEDQAVSPSGLEDASLVKESAALGTHRAIGNFAPVIGTTYTFSVYAKKKERTIFSIGGAGLYNSNELPEFDVDNGIAYNGGTGNATVNIQDVGNGWYRCSVTFTATGTSPFIVQLHDSLINSTPPSGTGVSYTGDGTSGMYFWGAQTEAASTPSSYIPTAGATVTRAAETLTIPSAKLPWPTPQIIGDELFAGATYLGNGWTDNGDGSYTSDGSDLGGTGRLNIVNDTVAGTVYYLTMDVSASSVDVRQGGTTIYSNLTTVAVVLVGDSGGGNINITPNGALTVSNISLREINPLSVSIQMDGRMTYADEGIFTTVRFFDWTLDANNNILANVTTESGFDGQLYFTQEAAGVVDNVNLDAFNPGVNVPFNIASRHGSTFVNGAVDGVALTANTTPTALPDLSATDLELGYDYMGTIARFRVWDVDLGDTGIEAATAPSLEPSLSLTFDSTEGSFTVDDWRA